MVEMAMILPLLLMLVTGIIYAGMAFHAWIELTGAVREGARVVALGGTAAEATAMVQTASPGLAPAPTVTSVTTCPPSGGGQGRISATYPVSYSIPIFGTGTWSVNATGVMRCGL